MISWEIQFAEVLEISSLILYFNRFLIIYESFLIVLTLLYVSKTKFVTNESNELIRKVMVVITKNSSDPKRNGIIIVPPLG